MQGDMTEGKVIMEFVEKLKGEAAPQSIRPCLEKLPTWLNRCRSGCTAEVVQLLTTVLETEIN